MKRYFLAAFLAIGIFGITHVTAQEPRTEKKDQKAGKKQDKMLKDEKLGRKYKADKKKEKEEKKEKRKVVKGEKAK